MKRFSVASEKDNKKDCKRCYSYLLWLSTLVVWRFCTTSNKMIVFFTRFQYLVYHVMRIWFSVMHINAWLLEPYNMELILAMLSTVISMYNNMYIKTLYTLRQCTWMCLTDSWHRQWLGNVSKSCNLSITLKSSLDIHWSMSRKYLGHRPANWLVWVFLGFGDTLLDIFGHFYKRFFWHFLPWSSFAPGLTSEGHCPVHPLPSGPNTEYSGPEL